jgi:capsular polysaccharide export protein
MKRGPLGPEFEGPLFAHGFSLRKRAFVRGFTGRNDVHFVRHGRLVRPGSQLLLWGSAPVPADLPARVGIVRLEDGFLRSVGLGADLIRPLSWVFDDTGIYYDARQASALEHILQDSQFEGAELTRAAALRERVVQAGLTKYNLAGRQWQRPRGPGNTRQVVLVPGQVETDASIAAGSVEIRTNLELLKTVRKARPDAWLVYKPHPDVVAGLRGEGADEARAREYCDEVLLEGSMHDLLLQVDEVHVLTSLSGFEALLRDKPVVCWGHPFYAGWGLTSDAHPHARRTRRLQLDELVAGALLRYPVYLSAATGQRCTPEQGLDELLQWRASHGKHDPWWRRWVRPLIARP